VPQKTSASANHHSKCGALIYTDNKTGLCRTCLDAANKAATPEAQLAT
jgi:hypothetical protein